MIRWDTQADTMDQFQERNIFHVEILSKNISDIEYDARWNIQAEKRDQFWE